MNDIRANLLPYVIGYFVFFALLMAAGKRDANRLTGKSGNLVYSRLLLLLHAAGIFLFGILPFLFAYPSPLLFFAPGSWPGIPTLVSLVLIVLMLFISPRLARQHLKNNQGPQSRFQALPAGFVILYFFLRTLFIVAYEIWFRGFLFSDSASAWGVPVAVFINIVFYTLLHTVNDKKELLGCLPFGLLLCMLTIWQGTVWPAVFLHLALAIPFELTLVRHRNTKTRTHENIHHRRIGLHRA